VFISCVQGLESAPSRTLKTSLTFTENKSAAQMAIPLPQDSLKESALLLGELMLQSHAGYTSVGMGSSGTDTLVRLVRKRMLHEQFGDSGSPDGVYGARITGGGSGGCVCILASNNANGDRSIRQIIDEYEKVSRYRPVPIGGSSSGAVNFGHVIIQLRSAKDSL
jgi:galactokinase